MFDAVAAGAGTLWMQLGLHSDEAVEIAKELQAANSGPSAYDIRPVMFYTGAGTLPARMAAAS